MFLGLQNANGPSAEYILLFHDFAILIILFVACLVIQLLILYFHVYPLNRGLTSSQALECGWTILPMVALLVLAIPSLRLLYLLDEVGNPVSTFSIISSQWYWSYESSDVSSCSHSSYLSPGPLRLLEADTPLVLPSSLILRLLLSSTDVLHSFALPVAGLKVDCVPGRLNILSTILDRPGIFYGQCSEICGSNHSFMPIKAEVIC